MRTLSLGLLSTLVACATVKDAASPALVVVAAGDVSHPEVREQEVTAKLVESLSPVAVLVPGDAQYGEGLLEEFQRAYEPTWGRFKDKTWPAPGNHEYKSGANGYFDYFGPRAGPERRGYYAFDLGDWHVISLNTGHLCERGACDEQSAQFKWLEADLAATKKKCVIAFWHHPTFNSGHHGPFVAALPMWKLMAAHHVELVLNGHEHFYERFEPLDAQGAPSADGVVQVTVGTGGIGFSDFKTSQPGSVVRQNDTLGVLKLTLRPSSWEADFVPVPGAKFTDHFSGTCR